MQRLIQTVFLGLLALTSLNAQALERITYYHNDALGSPVAATDCSGTLLWREEYLPYGDRILQEDNGTNTLWYTGKQEEEIFGINYFGARWYDPGVGRFMGMDRVGFDDKNIHSFNRYAYANNNPYKYIDPDGKEIVLTGSFHQQGEINASLTKIKQSNERLGSMIKKLEESVNKHSIRYSNPGEAPNNTSTGIKENDSNGIGTGTTTAVDVSKSYGIFGQMSPESSLAHELQHASDADQGIITNEKSSSGVDIIEERAVRTGNLYRESVDDKFIRKTYGGKPVSRYQGKYSPQ